MSSPPCYCLVSLSLSLSLSLFLSLSLSLPSPTPDSCEDSRYKAMFGFALLMMALWPVGVPLAFALVLWANRENLVCGEIGEVRASVE